MDRYFTWYRANTRAHQNNENFDQICFIDKNPVEKVHLIFCESCFWNQKNCIKYSSPNKTQKTPPWIIHVFSVSTLPCLSESLTPMVLIRGLHTLRIFQRTQTYKFKWIAVWTWMKWSIYIPWLNINLKYFFLI